MLLVLYFGARIGFFQGVHGVWQHYRTFLVVLYEPNVTFSYKLHKRELDSKFKNDQFKKKCCICSLFGQKTQIFLIGFFLFLVFVTVAPFPDKLTFVPYVLVYI